MHITARLGLAAFLIGSAAACGGSGSSSNPAPAPSPAPSGSTVTIVSGASTMSNTAYSPNPITVSRGTTVKWTNGDTTAHTSTANDGSWNSGAIAPGGSFSMTFQTAGSFAYHCTIHPNMVGSVTVQ